MILLQSEITKTVKICFMKSFDSFLKLHQQETPLLIGNFWDVNSARIFEQHGFKAIATSSSAVAHLLGYEDGEQIPFELLLQLAKKTTESTQIPCSVDLEKGYSRTVGGIVDNIKRLYDVGIVGINLEDTIPGTRQLQDPNEFQQTLGKIVDQLTKQGIKMFLNIRTDAFLIGLDNALPETISRIKKYTQAGANGIFVPCIVREDDIEIVTGSTQLPVNVMCMPGLPGFPVLSKLGVKRISMGSFMHRATNTELENKIKTVLEQQSFDVLFK
jgi:2-methylisocitrate lyase-like PEP mutase family enzyme